MSALPEAQRDSNEQIGNRKDNKVIESRLHVAGLGQRVIERTPLKAASNK